MKKTLPKINEDKVHFGYICPIPHLEEYVPQSATFHLCLAHLLDQPDYVDFYRKRQQRGDYILMDNSAYELGAGIDAEQLIDMVEQSQIQINAIVAPDYPGKHSDYTIESLNHFVDVVDKRHPDWSIMGVPQSEVGDFEDWLDCYYYMSDSEIVDLIGMSILGIPNACCHITGTNDISTNRIWATQYLLKHDPDHMKYGTSRNWHHYLGCGSPREYIHQKLLGLMDSTDSSSPIWHGLNGIRYDDSATALIQGKTSLAVDFNNVVFEHDPEDIYYNINEIEQFLTDV